MVKTFLFLAFLSLLVAPTAGWAQQAGRLSIADIETLLRDALASPGQRPLLRLLRTTVCGSPSVKREIDPALLDGLDCAGAAAPVTRGGPSFDCRKARTAVEHLICRDPGLAALDVILADAYNDVLARIQASQRASLYREEDRWLVGRDRCAAAGDVTACVTRAYTKRIQELNAY